MKLQGRYTKEVVPRMKEIFGVTNMLALPRLEKVIVNTGLGKFRENKDLLEFIERSISALTGQKPVPTHAKNAIAGFKIREGSLVGLRVTLRGGKMHDFLERLIFVALPRSRDFRGIDPKSIDSFGNMTIGVKEHIIFPEIIQEDIKTIFGFEVTIVTSAKTKKEAEEFFRLMGFPLKRES